jgi:hypothetical protein
MANEKQLEILKQGIDVWNQWREENPDIEIDLISADLASFDLRKADFRAIDLRGADLEKANLRAADLSEASINRAKIIETNLREANLRGAYLIRANLRTAYLNKADFRDTNLLGANLKDSSLLSTDLSKANLSKANFSNSNLGDTVFGDNDLSDSFGLEKIVHYRPSIIGIKTIQRSKGKLPVDFLRGCGLSDLEIEFAKLAVPSLDPEEITDITYKIHQLYLGNGIQYYSCFISYSSKDQVFAQKLHDDLQDNGVRCWFAPEDMKIGDQIRPTIDRQIRLRDKLLVILSENSMQSEWVGDEVEAAIEEEKESDRLVLFPIRLDDAVLNTREDWAAKIKRRRHIGDFSNWKDENAYQKAFERLLRDLKATGNQ